MMTMASGIGAAGVEEGDIAGAGDTGGAELLRQLQRATLVAQPASRA